MDDKQRIDWLEMMARKRGGLLLHAETKPTGRLGIGLAMPERTLRQAIDEAAFHRGESDSE